MTTLVGQAHGRCPTQRWLASSRLQNAAISSHINVVETSRTRMWICRERRSKARTKKRERRDERETQEPLLLRARHTWLRMGAVSSSLARSRSGGPSSADPSHFTARSHGSADANPDGARACCLRVLSRNWDPKAPGTFSDGNFVLNLDGATMMRRRLQFGLLVAMNEVADGEGAAVRRLQICTRAEMAD